jgi:hypothetical protein
MHAPFHDARPPDFDAGFPTQALVDALDSAISLLALSELSPQRIPSLVKHLQSLGHWLAQHGGRLGTGGADPGITLPGLLEGESQAVRSVLLTNSANGGGGCREPDAPPNHRGRTEAAGGRLRRQSGWPWTSMPSSA